VARYFSTSNPRRFNVKIYPAISEVDFFTSNRRRFYVEKYLCKHGIFLMSIQRRFNVKISLSIRTVDSSTSNITSIPRWRFTHGIRRFSTLNTRRFNVELALSTRTVNLSTSNILDSTSRFPHGISWFFDVECTSIQRWYFPINMTCRFFNVQYSATPCRGFPTVAKETSSETLRSTMMSLLPSLAL